ncbi:MAG: J domain-containing protein [Hyphomicrobiaceae bacterium]|nr:J domain-containing protein [Hyphomicrobiaceae bacterium]
MTAIDPYQELGLERSAGEDDIRRAFRKLAKELHPDLHPGDRAAAERFKRVSAAYEILGEPDKRAMFDRGEIDGSGEPRRGHRAARNGAGGFDFSFGDIFDEMFARERAERGPGYGFAGANGDPRARGRGQSRRGNDVRYTLEVDFLEAVEGVRKRVTMPEGGILDLNVPAAVADGQVLRLRGKGAQAPAGGEPGDALVEIKVRPHARFKRIGDDIHSEAHVTMDEALLGGRIEITTVDGSVHLTIPKATQQGRMFRLKGKGVRNMTTGVTGDHIVTVKVVMPPEVDDELSYFLANWRLKRKYDPGTR